MKLERVCISWNELKDYLDKYQDKIKFTMYVSSASAGCAAGSFILIIDMA